jgi:hypothetical protein
MSKRGKDKKKKRRTKSFASSSGGETTLLVGIQGRNVPVATCTLPAVDSSSHTTRRIAPRIEDGLPDLGSELPNLDDGSSHQAGADEKDWSLLADDLMEDGRDSLLGNCGQSSAMDPSTALARGPADPDRIAEPTAKQSAVPPSAVPASIANIQNEKDFQHEEGGDGNECEVDYSSEEKPESPIQPGFPAELESITKPVAETQSIIKPVAEFQSIIKPVTEFQSIIKPAAELQNVIESVAEIRNVIKPVAETDRDSMPARAGFQSNLRPIAAEFQIALTQFKPGPSGPSRGSTIQSSHVASVSASPQPIPSGSKDKAEVSDTRQERSIEQRATVLNRRVLKSADIMRLVKAKDIRVTRRHDHNLQQQGLAEDGVYELTDELDGYLSAGGQSVSVHHTVIELVVSAVQAEQPNLAALKAKQDAYDLVMQKSEEFLQQQHRDYEAQSARMLLTHKTQEEQRAREHERVMNMMQSESDRMLAEASQMRERYARAIASVPEPSFEEVTKSQIRLYDESLEKRLQLRVQTMEQRAEAETKRRKRKEDDLRIAEQRIEELKSTIKQLEEMVETNPKRVLPARGADDSPESHSDKRSRAVDTRLGLDPVTPLSNVPEVIQKSSVTPKKKAEIETSSSTPSKNTDAQLTISSSEDESGTDDDESSQTGSVASVPTWTPDPNDTTLFHADAGCVNLIRPNRPSVRVPPSRVRPRDDGLYNEEEMGRLTLEAWRVRLRGIHEYMPDRAFSGEYHCMKIRILQAALSHMKTNAGGIKGRALVEFHHEAYNHLMSEYGIPFYTCTASDLYGRIQDGRQLQRYRCVPVNQYYSMLMEDTPGFVQTPPSVTPRSRHQDDRSRSREEANGSSTSRNSSRQYPARSRRDVSGRDELEMLSSTDKERISELEMRILLVKQKRAPREYLTLRQEALDEAEAKRLRDKSTPDYLEGVNPPWNDGRKDVEDLYDEMMVEDFKKRIAAIRSSDNRRSSDESGKATKAKGGPGGQGRR